MLPYTSLEERRFTIEGWSELLVWPASDREVKHFDPPIKLLSVRCGLGPENNPPATEAKSV